MKSVVQANESRSYFVTQDEAEKVLDACRPYAQWRLIFVASHLLTVPLRWTQMPLRDSLTEMERYLIGNPAECSLRVRKRSINANLRTQLLKIINRAGLKQWPKPFQNLRSTRQTELEEIFPSHVVCAWIGNSEAVAKKTLSASHRRPL